MKGDMFGEFLEKAKKEYPYVGRFIEDRLSRYFNDYGICYAESFHFGIC
jgi:hypothetical protein